MKNNKLWIVIVFFIIIGLAFGIYLLTNKNKSNKSSYSTEKVSTNEQNTSIESNSANITSANNQIDNNISNTYLNNNSIDNTNSNASATSPTEPIQREEVIASFSTKIYNQDSARQNNIYITCSTLNNTTISNGSTFSFCNTVGPSTSSKGYKKADIFDKYGNKKKGFGGGNCQVSTTLYNAVLKVPSLNITERHEHSNKVPYIQKGKDAAVAYGSYDFKFINNSGFDIKINTEANSSNININLSKIGRLITNIRPILFKNFIFS